MYPQADNRLTLIYEGLLYDAFDLRTFKAGRITSLDTLSRIPSAKPLVINTGNIYNGTDWLFSMSPGKGIGWLNSKSGKIYYADTRNGLLQEDTLSALLQIEDGSVFLVSENGVHRSNRTKTRFEFIRFPTGVKRLAPDLYKESRLYAGSTALLPGNRLIVYQSDHIVLLDLEKKSAKTLLLPKARPSGLPEKESLLCLDAKGQPYFVHAGGVYRINDQDQPERVWQNIASPHLNITALFVDKSDVLWVSVNAQGITRIDLQAMPFHSYPYKQNFITDILEQAGIDLSLLPDDWTVPGETYFFRQARDSSNRLFFTKNPYNVNSVFQYDGKSLTRFRNVPEKAIYTALAVAEAGEICVYDRVKAVWYRWKTPESVPDTVSFGKSHMGNIELADAIYHKGSLWLSTYADGLLHYRGNKRISQFKEKQADGPDVHYMPRELTEICRDPGNENRFWIGSRGGGLLLWDTGKGLQKVYTTENGLPNNTIYCMVPDKTGKIWCSTNKGIFRLDPETGSVNSFEKSDGLQGNEFNRASKFRFDDGRIAFGGTEGYTIFDPTGFDVRADPDTVPVQLVNLQINNVPQGHTEQNSLVRVPLASLESIELPYHQNHLRFEFAAMYFNQPHKTKYRYRLEDRREGEHSDWIENGTSNVASYAALPPGSYKLQIGATDTNGRWSPAIKEVAFTIRPPFWATGQAYFVYVLLVIFLIRWYSIVREKRIRTEQNLEFEKREALRLKEMDEMKDHFFSNVTHEFRTPLTLIISPLEKLLSDQSLPPVAQHALRMIHKNSLQLLHLSNEFLDFSKLNDGQVELRLSSGELSFFSSNCLQAFEAAALTKNIRLTFSAEGIGGYYLFDHEKWRKIIFNLVGNALKFTPADGEISVLLLPAGTDRVRLEVQDNGPGIPADQHLKIFERFYQVDGSATRSHGGTGIGLSLVKELTGLMNGTVRVASEPGSFCRFTVEIPVQKITDGIAAKFVAGSLPQTSKAAQGNQPLVMIAEDNEELLSFIATCLEDSYRVIGASNGLTAWEVILEELPDVVISDVMMPGRDGLELCGLCKSDPRTAHIGFMLLTSKTARDSRMQGLDAGADDYITKPFQMDELVQRTSNLVGLQQKIRTRLRAQLFGKAHPVTADPFLASLYQEIESKLGDTGLGVDDLCQTARMSRSTLKRKLKAVLDTTPNELIRAYRLQKATGFLAAGLDITSTTYKVGFSSPSYFTQCFREHYGMTPSEYISRGD